MSHNQYPVSQENATFQHQEMLQFKDGSLALKFATKDDLLVLGNGSMHKYASNFDLSDKAIIRTASGNQYWVAGGYVMNVKAKKVYALPEEAINVRIGDSCTIPGVGITTPVDAVLIDYQHQGAPGYGEMVDAANPFKQVSDAVRSLQQQQGQS